MSGKEELTHAKLSEEFRKWSGKAPDTVTALPPSGSYRRYYRLISGNIGAIGASNPDIKENRAFLSFAKHFRKTGISVPEIYSENDDGYHYLLEDLGNKTLIDFLTHDNERKFNNDVIRKYQEALKDLAKIQHEGIKGMD